MATGYPRGIFGSAGPFVLASRRANQQPDVELTPEDEQGLLRSAVDVGLSGLAKVGNVLDLPGSSVRDILSGENPFDQWLPWNWTSGQNRTAPEDMLQKWGLMSPQFRKQHPVWSFIAGTGAAIGTDPLTYLGLPGVARFTKAGGIAKKAGVLRHLDQFLEPGLGRAQAMTTMKLGDVLPTLEDVNLLRKAGRRAEAKQGIQFIRDAIKAAGGKQQLAAQLDQPLGYRNWMPPEAGQKFARGMDIAGEFLGNTMPVKAARAAFSAAAGGFFPRWAQKTAEARSLLMPEARATARTQTSEFADDFTKVVKAFKDHFGPSASELPDEELGQIASDALRFTSEVLGGEAAKSPLKAGMGDTAMEWILQAATRRLNAPGGVNEMRMTQGLAPISAPQLTFADARTFTESLAAKLVGGNAQKQKHLLDMGLNVGDIDTYFPRQADASAVYALQLQELRAGRVMPVKGAHQMQRDVPIRDPYTVATNEMLQDDFIHHAHDAQGNPILGPKNAPLPEDLDKAAAYIKGRYEDWLDRNFGYDDAIKEAKGDAQKIADINAKYAAGEGLTKHSKALAKYIQAHAQRPMFTMNAIRDEGHYLMDQTRIEKTGEAIHEMFKRNAVDWQGNQPQNLVGWKPTFKGGQWGRRAALDNTYGRSAANMTLEKAYETARLDPKRAMEYFGRKFGVLEVDPNTGQLVMENVIDPATGQAMLDAAGNVMQQPKNWDKLKSFTVPAELANAVAGMMEASTNSEFISLIGQGIDHLNRLFKIGVTAHPANWIRNGYSGQFTNMAASGEFSSPSDFARYAKDLDWGWEHKSNPKSIRDAINMGYIDPAFGSEDVQFATSAAQMDPRLFGQNPFNVAESYRTAKKAVANPDQWSATQYMQALLGRPDAKAAPKTADKLLSAAQVAWQTGANTSAKANAWVEWMNRAPMYKYLTEYKGYSPLEAAEKVKALQLDYRYGLSGIEKSVMRRVMPFYSFSRLMAPVILKTLKDKPGGVMAQMIKASARIGGRDAFTPEYVSEGLSFPLGTTPEGDQRYFSATGLPYEDLFSFFGGRRPSRTMGLEALSRMTPYVKGPAEWVTGRSFFQQGPSGGRAIEDLDPVLGRTASNAIQYMRYLAGDKEALKQRPLAEKFPAALEQIASNSPLSRYFTSARTLIDPRKNALEKAVNLMTGARVTTISPQAQLAMAQERMGVLGKERFGGRDMTIFYVPEKELERLRQTDPEAYQQALKFKELQRVINKRRRDLREEAKAK